MHQAALKRMGISGLTKMRCSLPGASGFLITVPSGQVDHGHLHDPIHPHLGPSRLKVKDTNGRFKCSFFTNSIATLPARESALDRTVGVEPFK